MAPQTPCDADTQLIRMHAAALLALSADLDIDAGLEDATGPRRLSDLAGDLRESLDLESGLRAIVGERSPTDSSAQQPVRPLGEPNQGLGRVAHRLMSLDAATRIEMRNAQPGSALRETALLIDDLTEAAERAREYVVSTRGAHQKGAGFPAGAEGANIYFRPRGMELVGSRIRSRVVTLGSFFAESTPEVDPANEACAPARVAELGRIAAEVLSRVRPLSSGGIEQTRELVALLTRALNLAGEVVESLVVHLLDFLGDAGPGGATPSFQLSSIEDVRQLLKAWDRATNDFVGADLRRAPLHSAALERIRWSRSTQWPEEWEEEVRSMSIEIAPGIFEITGRGRRLGSAVTT